MAWYHVGNCDCPIGNCDCVSKPMAVVDVILMSTSFQYSLTPIRKNVKLKIRLLKYYNRKTEKYEFKVTSNCSGHIFNKLKQTKHFDIAKAFYLDLLLEYADQDYSYRENI